MSKRRVAAKEAIQGARGPASKAHCRQHRDVGFCPGEDKTPLEYLGTEEWEGQILTTEGGLGGS